MKAEVSDKQGLNHSSASTFSYLTDFIFYSNFAVGFCTSAAAATCMIENTGRVDFLCLMFIFCSTVFIYNQDHRNPSLSDKKNSPKRSSWITKNEELINIISLSLLSFCLLLLLHRSSGPVVSCSIFLLLTCALYTKKFKRLYAMKNIAVAAVWAVTVTILPSFWGEYKAQVNTTIICFCCALINTIIFDKRDITGDAKAGVKSIPVITSPKICEILIFILAAVTSIVAICSGSSIWCLVPICLVLINFYKESRLKYLLADLVLALPIISVLFI